MTTSPFFDFLEYILSREYFLTNILFLMNFTINTPIVLETKYQKGFWHEENNLYTSIWYTPISMNEEEYRSELIKYFGVIKEYRPKFILIKAKNARYNVKPETQEWMVKKYFSIYLDINLEKMAWLVSEDYFAQVSFEQTIDEAQSNPFEICYFNEENEAKKWLFT